MGVLNQEIPLGSYTVSIESVRKFYRGCAGVGSAGSKEAPATTRLWLPDH